jgi:hypothetical protein
VGLGRLRKSKLTSFGIASTVIAMGKARAPSLCRLDNRKAPEALTHA